MEKENILLAEYNNLWQEKLVHKQSLRKFKSVITYLTTIASVTLTLMGLSTSDLVKSALNSTAPSLIKNLPEILVLISIPLAPLFLLFISFAINDLFQIYVIANHIGNIEKKLNSLVGASKLLTWEHLICSAVFGSKPPIVAGKTLRPITNIIRKNDCLIFFPFVAALYFVPFYFSLRPLSDMNVWFFLSYIAINAYLLSSLALVMYKLGTYTKADSHLTQIMNGLHELAGTGESAVAISPDPEAKERTPKPLPSGIPSGKE